MPRLLPAPARSAAALPAVTPGLRRRRDAKATRGTPSARHNATDRPVPRRPPSAIARVRPGWPRRRVPCARGQPPACLRAGRAIVPCSSTPWRPGRSAPGRVRPRPGPARYRAGPGPAAARCQQAARDGCRRAARAQLALARRCGAVRTGPYRRASGWPDGAVRPASGSTANSDPPGPAGRCRRALAGTPSSRRSTSIARAVGRVRRSRDRAGHACAWTSATAPRWPRRAAARRSGAACIRAGYRARCARRPGPGRRCRWHVAPARDWRGLRRSLRRMKR